MDLHHIEVRRTARYLSEGNARDDIAEVWFLLHGYRQLARDFLGYCRTVAGPTRYLVAPEGLSRFYVSEDQIGASWMTREERTAEIRDYVNYLDAVYDEVFLQIERDRVSVRVLGFSQGVPTALRWADLGTAVIDQLIMWGERLPPEFDQHSDLASLHALDLHLVVGQTDEFVTGNAVEAERERMAELGLSVQFHTFDGGHRIDKTTLAKIADLPPAASRG